MDKAISEKYEIILGHKPTPEAVERLDRLAKTIGISDTDAFWSIFLGLEYYDRLFEEHPKRLHDAVISLQKKTPLQGWMWISLALGGVVILGAICFLSGIAVGGGNIPAWLDSTEGLKAAATAILRLPAGWILLLACFPWAAFYLFDLIIGSSSNTFTDLNPKKKFWKSKPFAIVLLIAYALLALKISFMMLGI